MNNEWICKTHYDHTNLIQTWMLQKSLGRLVAVHCHFWLAGHYVAIFTTLCNYFENLKRQFSFHDSTLCPIIFLWFLTKYLWSEMRIVKKNHSHKLSAMADNLWLWLAADHCVAIFSTCCSYLKDLKRQFYRIHSTLSYSLFMWFLEQYLWWKLR